MNNFYEKLMSALGATKFAKASGKDKTAEAAYDEASLPDLPTLIVTFPHPNQPEFHFINWERAPSVGSLERMTHHLFRAAQQETVRVRHNSITEALMTEAEVN